MTIQKKRKTKKVTKQEAIVKTLAVWIRTGCARVLTKGQVYDRIYAPIIDLEIFNQVQELLANNCNSHRRRYKAEPPWLLASKLYDDNNCIMSPSHAVKKGKRYRYYISQAYLQKKKELAGSIPQVPAIDLDQTSSEFINKKLEDLLKLENHSIEQYELYKQNLKNYLESWSLQSTLVVLSSKKSSIISIKK